MYHNKKPEHSKGGISCILPSIYDPVGIIQPYIVEGKIFLQKTWCYGKDQVMQWDNALPQQKKIS